MLADSCIASGHGIAAILCTFLFQLMHAAILLRQVRRVLPSHRRLPLIVPALVLVAFLSAAQIENFIDPFHVQFVLVYAAAAAAFDWTARARSSRHSALLMIAALVAASVSTLSMANGVLVWPLLLLLQWRLASPTLHRVATVGVMAINILALST